MNIIKNLLLTLVCFSIISSCSSPEHEALFGIWTTEYEDEVDGAGFYQQIETLSLNKDFTFTQTWAYLDDTHTDTIAKASINGKWQINDECLEMSYNPTSIVVTSIMINDEPIFFNHVLAKADYTNQQLEEAHYEGSTFGIKNVATEGNKMISKAPEGNSTPLEIYIRKE